MNIVASFLKPLLQPFEIGISVTCTGLSIFE